MNTEPKKNAVSDQPTAILYARVSTGRQAEHDLSIPDQFGRMRKYCEQRAFASDTSAVTIPFETEHLGQLISVK